MEFFEHPLIKAQSIEKRAYQERLINSVLRKGSTLVVAPTALGKTIIAAVLAAHFLGKGKNVLMVAPTKPLAMQHQKTLKKVLNIPKSEIVLITGAKAPKQRYLLYKEARVISATPQCIENDIKQKLIDLSKIGLCIFDEAHRAVGNYSYVFIAKKFKEQGSSLLLGLTASPGHEKERIAEICNNLGIKNIEIVTLEDEDVKPYISEIKLEWRKVELPEEFKQIKKALTDFIRENASKLKELSVTKMPRQDYFNRAKLLALQRKISSMIEKRGRERPELYTLAARVASLIKANHALILIETQGPKALWAYFQRLYEKDRNTKAGKMFLNNASVARAALITKKLVESNAKHPKLIMLAKIIQEQLGENPNSRIIVFNHYRDSVELLEKELNELENVKAKRFIGQAKRESKGMSQKEQAKAIKEFESNKINVLIATSVGEEGLDIPACDLVIFYEAVPSEIRHIQRRGRTARVKSGRVIILLTKGTRDEAYYWVARRKERKMLEQLKDMKGQNKIAKQQTLSSYLGE